MYVTSVGIGTAESWFLTSAVKLKGKGKVVLGLFFFTKHHTSEAYWWSGGIAPCIL
jgi:hypothetical protein